MIQNCIATGRSTNMSRTLKHIIAFLILSTSRCKAFTTSRQALIITQHHNQQNTLPLFPGKYYHQRGNVIMMGQRGKRIKKEIKKELQMDTPPRIKTPYGDIRMMRPLSICPTCQGRGVVRCNVSSK